MKYIKLVLIIFLLPSVSLAQECKVSPFHRVQYTSTSRGTVVLHIIPPTLEVSATDLVCLAGNELIRRAADVPNRLVVGIVTESLSKVQLIQWDLEKNFLTIVDIRLPEGDDRGVGSFTTYDSPLDRLSELLISKPLPTPGTLGATVTSNYTRASKATIAALIEGKDSN